MGKKTSIALALLASWLVAGSSPAQSPVVVSPGSAETMLTVAERCPTFSWTAAADAHAFEIVLYRLLDGETPEEASELFRMSLPPGSSAWTPPLDRCLEPGGRYAWSVRPAGEAKAGDWAAPALFSVAAEPSLAELESLLAGRRALRSAGRRLPLPGTDEWELARPLPRTTNTGGNFFDESVQIAGDLCAGEECTDGEGFPLGTIRIDSDNPSIAFNDASVAAGFPTNDWEIQVNDTTNGGDDYFAIEDVTAGTVPFRIEAGSGDEGLRIADGFVDFGGDLSAPNGDLTTVGVNLASSREWKQDHEPVDAEAILAGLSTLPISTWSFIADPEVRHIGPVAEEFHAAFALPGHDPRHLAVTDVNGVALAAIQALARRTAEQRREIEELRHRSGELERMVLELMTASVEAAR